MKIQIYNNSSLAKEKIFLLLEKADTLFTPPLSAAVDLAAYSEKLYAHANFVACSEEGEIKAFTAFYKNTCARQLYVTLICVDKQLQGQGIGSKMLEALESLKGEGFDSIALEVVKTNQTAYQFYKKHGFVEQEDRGEKFLMLKAL